MDNGEYVSLVFELDFERQCAEICKDVRCMDDHLRALDYLLARAAAKGIVIPQVPGTDRFVVRLDARAIGDVEIPTTRIFFHWEGEKAHLDLIEIVRADDDEEEDFDFGDIDFGSDS